MRLLGYDFIIKQNSRGYIVIRQNYPYEFHAHVKALSTCHALITLINNNKLPKSQYLRGSCRRLLTEEEYSRLKGHRDYYININKGIRR